jgi:hypothetical protein
LLKCTVCNSTEFAEVLNFKKTVFSDGYTIEKPLIKEECKQCGTIRTKIELNLREFYRSNYNPSRNIDTLVFIDEQSVNRSYFIYNWISSLIHHFSHQNFIKLLNKCGFSVVNYELGRGSYANIGMYVCKKTNKREEIYFDYIKNINLQNINIILKNIDNIIEIYKDKPLFAFGYGEIAKTILPYSDLDNYIISYIDEYNCGSKIISTDEAKLLFKDRPNVNLVLLVNLAHMEKVKSLFNGFNNIEFIDIFKGVKGDLE